MDSSEEQVLVRFITKNNAIKVTETPFELPTRLTRSGLSEVVNHLLRNDPPQPFDFLINGQFLRSSLQTYLERNDITAESTLVIEYVEAIPPPTPSPSIPHDDWISSVKQISSGHFATACYDGVVRIFENNGSEPLLSLPHQGFNNSISDFCHVSAQSDSALLVAASFDSNLYGWQLNSLSATPSRKLAFAFRGHTASVQAVAANPTGSKIISGSQDASLRIWAVPAATGSSAVAEVYPTDLLQGHTQAVTCVQWIENDQVLSGSLDHGIKLWDMELCEEVGELKGTKAVTGLAAKTGSSLVLSAHSDKVVRLWDSRVQDGAVVKQSFVSHKTWVSSVAWIPKSDHLFVTGSYDNTVKVWDLRSRVPLYTLTGHEGKVLCVDCDASGRIRSGGEDKTLKTHIVDFSSSA